MHATVKIRRAIKVAKHPMIFLTEHVKKCTRGKQWDLLDTGVFSSAMAALARQRQVDSVWEVWDMMNDPLYLQNCDIKPNIYTYNALLSTCSDVFTMADIMRRMRAERVEPTVHSYTSVLRLLLGAGERAAALEILRGMDGVGLKPEPILVAIVMRAASDADHAIRLATQYVLTRTADMEIPRDVLFALYDKVVSPEDMRKAAPFESVSLNGRLFCSRVKALHRASMHAEVISSWDLCLHQQRPELLGTAAEGAEGHPNDLAHAAGLASLPSVAGAYLQSVASLAFEGGSAMQVLWDSAYYKRIGGGSGVARSPSVSVGTEVEAGRVRRIVAETLLVVGYVLENPGSPREGQCSLATGLLSAWAAVGDCEDSARLVALLKDRGLCTSEHTGLHHAAALNAQRFFFLPHETGHPPPRDPLLYDWEPWAARYEEHPADLDARRFVDSLMASLSQRRRLMYARAAPL